MDVRARIFLRAGVATLGIAPLTSMFFFGENQPHRTDFRPEVHDSDGLMVATGDGEWLWRPLLNPKQTLTTSFSMRDAARLRPDAARPRVPQLRGQRGALRAAAERLGRADRHPGGRAASSSCSCTRPTRPTTTSSRTGCRATLPAPGQPLDFTYRLHWQGMQQEQRPPGAWAAADARRPRLRRAGRRRAAISSSTSPVHRSPRCRPMRAVKAVVTAPANGQDHGEQRVSRGSHWRVAHDGARQAAQPQRSRPSCAASFRAATMCSRRRGATSCRRCCSDEARSRSVVACSLCAAPRRETQRRSFCSAPARRPPIPNARGLRRQSSSTRHRISSTSARASFDARPALSRKA